MSTDFVVDIQPDAAELRLVIHAGATKDEVTLQPLALGAQDLNDLMSGEVTEAIARQLSSAVTQWFLRAEIRAYLKTLIDKQEPVRLVLCIHSKLLDSGLADLPFEMLEWAEADPFALKPMVRSIVHLLPKVGTPRRSPLLDDWPLRVLIVRSNPLDLGGAVPEAGGIRDHIVKLVTDKYGSHHVHVQVLSREPGIQSPATWESLREEIAANSYHVLVFLGHGDIIPGFETVPPTGILQFETPDGKYARQVSSSQLKVELQNHPVPVVLLAGCLTAAQIPQDRKASIRAHMPTWMRGSQGVAQALVNSESGVQIAVGMRYRLETSDAERFLKEFFRSLVDQARGDVEAAVRAGRAALFADRPYPPSWSAPVIFRTPGQEPTFEFLVKPPMLVDPLDEPDQQFRALAWTALSKLPLSGRVPDVQKLLYDVIQEAEKHVRDRSEARQIPLLMTTRAEAAPVQWTKLQVELFGTLTIKSLRGRVVFSDRSLAPRDARRSEELKAAGFNSTFQTDNPGELSFRIEPADANPRALPAGPLFSFELQPGKEFPAICSLQVEDLVVDPPRSVRGWVNALIVCPP